MREYFDQPKDNSRAYKYTALNNAAFFSAHAPHKSVARRSNKIDVHKSLHIKDLNKLFSPDEERKAAVSPFLAKEPPSKFRIEPKQKKIYYEMDMALPKKNKKSASRRSQFDFELRSSYASAYTTKNARQNMKLKEKNWERTIDITKFNESVGKNKKI
jgi:hypothetical protein